MIVVREFYARPPKLLKIIEAMPSDADDSESTAGVELQSQAASPQPHLPKEEE